MMKNKGFSLVELIIVIAIMAILVGVLTPQLLKYIEKSKVSSDTQLCDTIHSAIQTTLSDPKIVNSTDPKTQDLIRDFTTPNQNKRLDQYVGTSYQNSDFVQNVTSIVGFNPFQNCTTYNKQYLKSTPARDKGIICIQTNDSGNSFWIYISHSDKTAQKQDFDCNTVADLKNVICAPAYD